MEKRINIFPITDWLGSYKKEWIGLDLVGGLTASTVVVPQAMAYAAIAGLPLVVGLYTSLLMLVVYAVMGTSRLLSVTTTSTIAILTAGILQEVAPGADEAALLSATATLSLLVGSFLLVGGLLRLGVVANLISYPVLIGFKAGIGLVIILGQVPKLLGVHITKAGFFRDIVSIVGQLPGTSLPTLLLAAAMFALMLGLAHFVPRVPASLVTVVAGISLAAFAGLDKAGVSLVGTVQAGLPPFALPDLSLVEELWPAAMGIALMSFVETAAAGRAFINKGDPFPEANRELIATGAANIVGSFFSAMPGGGGTSQTAVTQSAGGRSQVAGLVCAAVVVATLLFLAHLFGLMPNATLAVVVIVACSGLVKPAEFRAIKHVRTMEFRWAFIAAAGVMVLGTLKGLLVAVLVSMVALIFHANTQPILVLGRKPGTNVFRPRSPEHPEDETFPGLLLLRPEGSIHFANAQRLGQKMRELLAEFTPKILVLDLSAVPLLEYTALRMMAEGEERLRDEGTTLWLVALNPDVVAVMQRSPLWERLGRERMFFSLEQAVAKYQEQATAVAREPASQG
ncbi:MAG TPA: SulP family inorganic anion transporter [Geobacteraceae bacterium]|nr:SulP family inorganic anion transporter [Geobacteraceae bacterium]